MTNCFCTCFETNSNGKSISSDVGKKETLAIKKQRKTYSDILTTIMYVASAYYACRYYEKKRYIYITTTEPSLKPLELCKFRWECLKRDEIGHVVTRKMGNFHIYLFFSLSFSVPFFYTFYSLFVDSKLYPINLGAQTRTLTKEIDCTSCS